jgi:hypothetical protein
MVTIAKRASLGRGFRLVEHLRKHAGDIKMTTDKIMALTRGDQMPVLVDSNRRRGAGVAGRVAAMTLRPDRAERDAGLDQVHARSIDERVRTQTNVSFGCSDALEKT